MSQGGDSMSRRRFLLGVGAVSVAGAAGCTSQRAIQPGRAATNKTRGLSALTADGSSTVYPIANTAAKRWNGNPPATDAEYWPHEAYGIDTDHHLADYFASKYGFEPTETRSTPPFRVNIAISHSGTGVNALREQRVDIGNSSAPVADELPDASEDTLAKFVNHVVGVDAQPIVVSEAVYDAGVTGLTAEELRQIYRKQITNWAEVGGPDRSIRVIGRAEKSGTDTAFRANLYGDPNAPIDPDVRKGQNQQVSQLVAQSDNAIAYLALAFVEPDGAVRPISLEVNGTVYTLGKNLGAKEYPLSRDLHMYTWAGTSRKEAAYLEMILSDFGQDVCVAGNNYFRLPADRREKQLNKLPHPR